jgi:diguanylate cyclase (GGDEF)-like protein
VGGVLVAAGVHHLDRAALHSRWSELVLFAALVLLTEMRPVTVVRASGIDQIVTSTTFAFAVFIAFGPVPAMAAQLVASLAGDLVERKQVIRTVFNVGQYAVGWGTAGLAYGAILEPSGPWRQVGSSTPRWALAVATAALVYFLVNNALVGIVVALSRSAPLATGIRDTIAREAGSDLLLLGLAPVVVVVAERSLLLLPLLLAPVLAVYRGAALAAEKDHQALHDSLTDLPNRLHFLGALEARIARRQSARSMAAVLLIDLDRFKEVNDTLGHHAGDELLRHIGPRLTGVLPDGATVARLGGDEFAVLVPTVASETEALAIGAALSRSLDEPFRVGEFNLEVAASVGVALFPSHGTTTELLLKHADVAMYVAKGCNARVELYDPEQDRHSTRRLGLMSELRAALGDGQVVLYYQPKLDLRTQRVHEVEALVRWIHPQLGLIPPAEFVPLAEHTGLIRPLTSHVLALATAQVGAWRAEGIDLAVSVNLSARSLQDSAIADEIDALLAERQLPATALHLEITESSIMADPARAKRVLERLNGAGVHLSVDDFGTGYSSLAYLQDLPVGEIKIDRSFVMNMLDNEADQVIVRSTIELARNLGLTSTAEGVESAEALEWLFDAGCDHAQGYHIARPMTAEALGTWIATRQGHVDAALAGHPALATVVPLFPSPRMRKRNA